MGASPTRHSFGKGPYLYEMNIKETGPSRICPENSSPWPQVTHFCCIGYVEGMVPGIKFKVDQHDSGCRTLRKL